MGVLYSNVANNGGDMTTDIHLTGGGSPTVVNLLNGAAVINTALTLGDRLNDMKMIAMHSHVYSYALINDEITFFKPSVNSLDIPTYKGMGVSLTTAWSRQPQASTSPFCLVLVP
jgi:hypothetical protein